MPCSGRQRLHATHHDGPLVAGGLAAVPCVHLCPASHTTCVLPLTTCTLPRAHQPPCRERVPLARVIMAAKVSPQPRDFIGAIQAATQRTGKPGLIAEVGGLGGSRGSRGVLQRVAGGARGGAGAGAGRQAAARGRRRCVVPGGARAATCSQLCPPLLLPACRRAQVKKASPSKGVIQPNFDPVKVGTVEGGGAAW